ncbi:MAG: hypothetical protein AAF628_22745 [Planctomycetota bacterium]
MPSHIRLRRAAILSLLQEQNVRSQAELGDLLAEAGHPVNQTTLSRDLRALGVRKGPAGYELSPDHRGEGPEAELLHAAASWLQSATPAQNLAVLKTPPSGAQPLALALDRSELDGVVGTVAGDDTVLVICVDARHAGRLCRRLLTKTQVPA